MVYVTVEIHKLCCTFCDHREVAEKQDLSHTRFHCDSPAPNVLILFIWRLKVNEPTEIPFLCFQRENYSNAKKTFAMLLANYSNLNTEFCFNNVMEISTVTRKEMD